MPNDNTVKGVDHGKRVWDNRILGSLVCEALIASLAHIKTENLSGVVVGLQNGRVYVCHNGPQVDTGSIHRLHDDGLLSLVAGGQRALSISTDGTVSRIDLDQLSVERRIFVAKKNWPTAVAVSSDGSLGAITSGSQAAVLDLGNENAVVMQEDAGGSCSYTGVAFSRSGQHLGIGSQGKLVVYDIRSSQSRDLIWQGSHIDVFWSPSEEFICSTTHDRELHVWNLESGKDFRLGGFGRKIRVAKWNESSTQLAAVADEVVVVWTVDTQSGGFYPKPIEIGCGTDCGHCTAFSWVDDARMIVGFSDGSVILSDVSTGAGVFLLSEFSSGASINHLVAAGEDNAIVAINDNLISLDFAVN